MEGVMVKRTARIVAPAEYILPASFNREIGRTIVSWAYFEHLLRHIAWDLLGVSDKIGRVAVRDPRIDDRLDMLLDVAYLKKISLDQKQIAKLKTKVAEVSRWRHLLAHGVWIPRNGNWLLQMTGGQYPKNFEAEHHKRRINPEGINVDIDGLRSVTSLIESLIEEASKIGGEIQAQLQQSPGKDQAR
jgi:hypothetical protein